MNNWLTIWLTGLSGSGKSTFAQALKQKLEDESLSCVILDGDTLRSGLCNDLGYTQKDRTENNRRIAEVAKVLNDGGIYAICAIISPMQKDRRQAKSIIGAERFKEVFLSASLGVCEKRDTKGLYAKARKGEIKSFTGVSAPYEKPLLPDLIIPDVWLPQEAADFVFKRFACNSSHSHSSQAKLFNEGALLYES